MPRPNHFEIIAKDPARATEFYKNVFGWTINKWDSPDVDYWLIETGKDEPGIDGAIMGSEGPAKGGTVNTTLVPDIQEFADKVKKAGGQVVMDVQDIPEVGQFAYCLDSEGNVFGIMQPHDA